VRTANAAGLRGVDLDGAMLDAAAQALIGRPIGLTGRDLSEVLDPRRIVATRTAAGGAAPPVVEGMAESCREQAAELLGLARRRRAGFRAAERGLLERAAAVVAGTEGGR
jgi:argininosuccinate lyase